MAKKEIVPVEVQVNTSEANKNLNKTQDAIEGVNKSSSKIKNLASGFGNLAKTIGGNVVKAFTSLKLAAAAVNFGAIIELVKKLYENWESIQKVITNFIPGFGKFVNLVKGLVQNFTDFIGLTSQAERDAEALAKSNERVNETIDDQIRLLQAVGGQEEKIFALQKQKNENELTALRQRLTLTKTLSEEELKRFRELKNDQAVLDAAEKKRKEDIEAQRNKEAAAEAKRKSDEAKRLKEQAEKEKEAKDQERRNRIGQALLEDNFARVEEKKKDAAATKERDIFNIVNQEKIRGLRELKQQSDEQVERSIENLKRIADAEKAKEELKKQQFESEVALAQQSLSIIGGLVDQNSAAGKGVAVAQAIINTYQGASRAIAQGGIFGPVAAAATIAAGLIQVKKIVSTKIPSVGGGSVAEKGVSVNASAPISPTPNIQATLTQLDQSTVNRLGSASARAYVVESDITSKQEQIKRINRAARLS